MSSPLMWTPPSSSAKGLAKVVYYHVAKWFDDTHAQLADVVNNYMRKKKEEKL